MPWRAASAAAMCRRRLLAERLLEKDHAADVARDARRRQQQMAVVAPRGGGRFDADGFEAPGDRRGAFIGGEQALAGLDQRGHRGLQFGASVHDCVLRSGRRAAARVASRRMHRRLRVRGARFGLRQVAESGRDLGCHADDGRRELFQRARLETVGRARQADRAAHVAARTPDRRRDAAHAVAPFAAVDGIADPANLVEVGLQRGRRRDRVRREGLQFQRDLIDQGGRCVRQQALPVATQ